jgi:hypothetical protein
MMMNGGASVDQIYESGKTAQPAAAAAAPGGMSVGMWIIIGIAILAAVVLIIFALTLIFGKKAATATTTPTQATERRPRRRGIRQMEEGEYEGGYDPNPARYDRSYGPGEGYEPDDGYDQQAHYRQQAPRDRVDRESYGEEVTKSGLGAPRIIRADSQQTRGPPDIRRPKPKEEDLYRQGMMSSQEYEPEQAPPRRGERHVRFADDQMDVADLVQSNAPRRQRERLVDDEVGPVADDVESRLMKSTPEGRTLKGNFSPDNAPQASRYEAPTKISNPGGGRYNPPPPTTGRQLSSPSTAKASQTLMRAFAQ